MYTGIINPRLLFHFQLQTYEIHVCRFNTGPVSNCHLTPTEEFSAILCCMGRPNYPFMVMMSRYVLTRRAEMDLSTKARSLKQQFTCRQGRNKG